MKRFRWNSYGLAAMGLLAPLWRLEGLGLCVGEDTEIDMCGFQILAPFLVLISFEFS